MRLLTVRRNFEEGECHPLFFWGDMHLGNANCAKEALHRDRDTIRKTKNAMYVHMGDSGDFIDENDRRFKADHVDWDLLDRRKPIIDETIRALVEFEKPVIDKCIAAVKGNHEITADRANNTNVTVRRLERMDSAGLYCGSAALVRIIFTDSSKHACQVVLNIHHGKRTAKSKATLLNAYIQKLRYWPDVDILARGHCHYYGVEPESRVCTNTTFSAMKDKLVWAALSGGYLKTFLEDGSCYAEDGDYDPIDIGYQRFDLYPSRHGCRIKAVTG